MEQPDINQVLSVRSKEQFESTALGLFRFQAVMCPPYRDYIADLGIDPGDIHRVADIPFMPIGLFKSRDVWCGGITPPEKVFTSSTTTGMTPSRHFMRSLAEYEKCFTEAFEMFYVGGEYDMAGTTGAPPAIFALLPGYLERDGSSLIYMVDRLIKHYGCGGFFLRNHSELLDRVRSHKGRKIILGVSYALWDLAEEMPTDLSDTIIMETGGMKGHREEISKEEFHRILCRAFNVENIHSEFGMAEMTSQAYSFGRGVFRAPHWVKVMARDLNDPSGILPPGRIGGMNIIDLGNLHSCAFIQTQDMCTVMPDGTFTLHGRIRGSDIRGCNLLVQ